MNKKRFNLNERTKFFMPEKITPTQTKVFYFKDFNKNITDNYKDFQEIMDEYSALTTYTDAFIDELIEIYEIIGSFIGVKNHILKKYDLSISDYTIKKKIEEKFKEKSFMIPPCLHEFIGGNGGKKVKTQSIGIKRKYYED